MDSYKQILSIFPLIYKTVRTLSYLKSLFELSRYEFHSRIDMNENCAYQSHSRAIKIQMTKNTVEHIFIIMRYKAYTDKSYGWNENTDECIKFFYMETSKESA